MRPSLGTNERAKYDGVTTELQTCTHCSGCCSHHPNRPTWGERDRPSLGAAQRGAGREFEWRKWTSRIKDSVPETATSRRSSPRLRRLGPPHAQPRPHWFGDATGWARPQESSMIWAHDWCRLVACGKYQVAGARSSYELIAFSPSAKAAVSARLARTESGRWLNGCVPEHSDTAFA